MLLHQRRGGIYRKTEQKTRLLKNTGLAPKRPSEAPEGRAACAALALQASSMPPTSLRLIPLRHSVRLIICRPPRGNPGGDWAAFGAPNPVAALSCHRANWRHPMSHPMLVRRDNIFYLLGRHGCIGTTKMISTERARSKWNYSDLAPLLPPFSIFTTMEHGV